MSLICEFSLLSVSYLWFVHFLYYHFHVFSLCIFSTITFMSLICAFSLLPLSYLWSVHFLYYHFHVFGHPLLIIIFDIHYFSLYSKTCVKWPLSKRAKISDRDRVLFNANQKYCGILHSAILSTFIELPYVFKIVSMIRIYHNHKPQTTPLHREEEPLNHHETPGRQFKQGPLFCILCEWPL